MTVAVAHATAPNAADPTAALANAWPQTQATWAARPQTTTRTAL